MHLLGTTSPLWFGVGGLRELDLGRFGGVTSLAGVNFIHTLDGKVRFLSRFDGTEQVRERFCLAGDVRRQVLHTTGARQSGNTPGIGARLPT